MIFDVRGIWNYLMNDNVNNNTPVRWINCPLHNEKTPSFNFNFEKELWYCFGCHKGGDIITFVQELKQVNFQRAQEIIKDFKKGIILDYQKINDVEKKEIIRNHRTVKKQINQIDLPKTFEKINTHIWLENKRKLTKQEIEIDGWGIIKDKQWTNRVVLPIYTEKVLKSYFGRDITGRNKVKSRNADNALNSEAIWNYDNVKDDIYIVEGYFDAIKFRRLGYNVMALNWNRITDYQANLLSKFKKIILVPDNDNGGKILLKDSIKLISRVEIIEYIELIKKDADEHNERELKYCILQKKYHISKFLKEFFLKK